MSVTVLQKNMYAKGIKTSIRIQSNFQSEHILTQFIIMYVAAIMHYYLVQQKIKNHSKTHALNIF